MSWQEHLAQQAEKAEQLKAEQQKKLQEQGKGSLSTLAMGNKKVEAKNKNLKKVLGKYNKNKEI